MKQANRLGVVLALLVAGALACDSSSTPTESPKVKTATPEIAATVANDVVSEATDEPEATVTRQALATDTEEPTPEPTEPPVVGYLEDFVEQDGIALAALQVADPATPGVLYEKGEGKRLVAVELVLANVDVDPISVNPLDFAIQDAEGFTYQVELGGSDLGQLALVTIAPGQRVRGWVAFEVDEAAV
jgi:hypothetical protein